MKKIIWLITILLMLNVVFGLSLNRWSEHCDGPRRNCADLTTGVIVDSNNITYYNYSVAYGTQKEVVVYDFNKDKDKSEVVVSPGGTLYILFTNGTSILFTSSGIQQNVFTLAGTESDDGFETSFDGDNLTDIIGIFKRSTSYYFEVYEYNLSDINRIVSVNLSADPNIGSSAVSLITSEILYNEDWNATFFGAKNKTFMFKPNAVNYTDSLCSSTYNHNLENSVAYGDEVVLWGDYYVTSLELSKTGCSNQFDLTTGFANNKYVTIQTESSSLERIYVVGINNTGPDSGWYCSWVMIDILDKDTGEVVHHTGSNIATATCGTDYSNTVCAGSSSCASSDLNARAEDYDGDLYRDLIIYAKGNTQQDNDDSLLIFNPSSRTWNLLDRFNDGVNFFDFNFTLGVMSSNTSYFDIITKSRILNLNLSAIYNFTKTGSSLVIPVDLDYDADMELIIPQTGAIYYLDGGTTNNLPSIVNIFRDTCNPVCLDNNITFTMPAGGYNDTEGNIARINLNCTGSLKGWTSYFSDADEMKIGCNATKLGSYNYRFYITDISSPNDLTNYIDIPVDVSSNVDCYLSGDDSDCITKITPLAPGGISEPSGVYKNQTIRSTGNYVSEYYDFDFRCDNTWQKGIWIMLYPVCPIWYMIIDYLDNLKIWIFSFFVLFLVIILLWGFFHKK